MWLLLALLVALCWGLVLACVKRAYSSFTPTTFVIVGSLSAVTILLPFSLMNGARFVFWPLLPIATIVGILFIFEFYALEKGRLSLTGTVLNMYPFFTLIFASLLLNESISTSAKFGIGIILAGLTMISIENLSELKNIRFKSWHFLGFSGSNGNRIWRLLNKGYGK